MIVVPGRPDVPVIINGAGVTIHCPNASGGGGLSFEASGNVVTGLTITGVPNSTIGLVFGDAFGISNGNTVTGVTGTGDVGIDFFGSDAPVATGNTLSNLETALSQDGPFTTALVQERVHD